jgi:hypothetical protein
VVEVVSVVVSFIFIPFARLKFSGAELPPMEPRVCWGNSSSLVSCLDEVSVVSRIPLSEYSDRALSAEDGKGVNRVNDVSDPVSILAILPSNENTGPRSKTDLEVYNGEGQ